MTETTRVEPLSGFRDFNQTEQAQRLWLIDQALTVYSQFGYRPIETPALELNEVLNGQYGEEGDKLRYSFTDKGNRRVGLRYDLTVPFARVVARWLPRQEIQLPYRRSQVAPVWRAESPQAGRYREFYQCDFDIAGTSDAWADAEVVTVAVSLLQKINVDFRLRINHRGVLDGLLRSFQINPDAVTGVMVTLDKYDKIGAGAVEELLVTQSGITPEQAHNLVDLVGQQVDEEQLRAHLDSDGQSALTNLLEIVSLAQGALPPDMANRVTIDLSIVRGLSYYTGLVLETTVKGAERYGSILSGGRYDQTIGTFLGRPVPAVGASLGLDRCLTVLGDLGLLPADLAKADIALLAFPDAQKEAFALASRLRQSGHSIIYSVITGKVGAAFMNAEKVARQALLVGQSEVASATYKLRNLETRSDTVVREEDLIVS